MEAGVQYRILFVGLGSIGKRHLHNITAILKSRNISFQMDAFRKKNERHEGISNIYTTREDIPDGYDIIFITNPTSLHYEIMTSLKNRTKHFFVEKPIFDKVQAFDFSGGVCYIACPLRFHPVVRNLRDFTQDNNILAFRAICSSYLPDWRPGVDYKDNYSVKKTMGGGVELDLIHEIDYLKWIWGKPIKVHVEFDKKSNLEINSNDVALYIVKFSKVIGTLHLDYFGRYQQKNRREIEVFTNDSTILFDITNNSVCNLLDNSKTYLDTEDIYLNEMNYFLDTIMTQNSDQYNSIPEAIDSLRIASGECK
jgi:predicted dehydrogenase